MGELVLAGILSALIGVVLGLLGGGGGILAVPVLVYVVGVAAKSAIAMSLFLVGTTSAVGTTLAARAGRVRWKMGGLFASSSMAGAFLGGQLARFVPERALLVALAAVMLATALAMFRERAESADAPRPIAVWRILVVGAAVGVVSGLVGAGGGFLIVPALTLFGGLAMREAIGTSLFIIAAQSFAGFVGHVTHVALDWRLLAITTAAAVLGMYAGSTLGKRVSVQGLKRGFSALVFVTGSVVLGRELSLLWTTIVILVAIVVAPLLVRKSARSPKPSGPEKESITSARFRP